MLTVYKPWGLFCNNVTLTTETIIHKTNNVCDLTDAKQEVYFSPA